MPVQSSTRSSLLVCDQRTYPGDIPVYPPTSDGDRAALITALAAILVRVAQEQAKLAAPMHARSGQPSRKK